MGTQPNPTVGDDVYWTWARLYSVQTGWGTPTIVSNQTYSTYDAPWAGAPLAAIDDSGIAIALWESGSLGSWGRGIAVNVHRPGTGWGTEEFVHRGSWNAEMNIAMDGNGNAVAGYMHDGGGGYGSDPYARSFSAATGWAPPHRFRAPATGGYSRVAVGLDATGAAMAVWGHSEDSIYAPDNLPHYKVYFSRRPPNGIWTSAVAIASPRAYVDDFSLAVADNGNAVVSWRERPEGAPIIYAAPFENAA